MICKDCAIDKGGKAQFVATTMQNIKCPYCEQEKPCVNEYKYGLELNDAS